MRAIAPKWTGRLWPNGEFGVSRVREAPFLSLCESHRETAESQFNRVGIKAHGILAVLEFRGKLETVMHPGLSIRAKSRNYAKRGSKGITSYGQKMVRNCGLILERRYKRQLLSFGTLTVPLLPAESAHAVTANWPEIVRRFQDNLMQKQQRLGLPTWRVCVTEIQEERFETYGDPVLHLHLCFVARNSQRSAWQIDHSDLRNWWRLALKPYVPPDTDFTACENLVGVEKSVAGYLGKYMSKGSKAAKVLKEKGVVDWHPSAWWNASKALRKAVLSQVVSGEQVGYLLNWLCENPIAEWIVRSHQIIITSKTGVKFGVGWGGRVSEDARLQISLNVVKVCTP